MVKAIAITYWAWVTITTMATIALSIYRYDSGYVFFSQPDAMAVSAVLVILLANLLIVNIDSYRKV